MFIGFWFSNTELNFIVKEVYVSFPILIKIAVVLTLYNCSLTKHLGHPYIDKKSCGNKEPLFDETNVIVEWDSYEDQIFTIKCKK